jgi:hypothetical protein
MREDQTARLATQPYLCDPSCALCAHAAKEDSVTDPPDEAAKTHEPSDFLAVLSPLRAALQNERGKIRVADVQKLAGLGRRSYYRSRLIAQALRHLGWKRGRCRFDGSLAYAYVKGTPLQREDILEVECGPDGQFVLKRRAS